jgi:hypothetical protein
MEDTRIVAELLGKAMRNGDTLGDDDPGGFTTAQPLNDARFGGLDVRFHGILCRLISRPRWQRPEYESMAREFNLMPGGVFDVVNEWSYANFNDPILVDDGDQFEVQTHLLGNLK